MTAEAEEGVCAEYAGAGRRVEGEAAGVKPTQSTAPLTSRLYDACSSTKRTMAASGA
jgi:hypothetical protein